MRSAQTLDPRHHRPGPVTLKGLVSTEGDRSIAIVRAKGVSGVFDVTNELTLDNSEAVKRREGRTKHFESGVDPECGGFAAVFLMASKNGF
jgi:hypothetical protein